MSLYKTALLLLVLSAVRLSAAADPPPNALPKITIDKATTFITKPLGADGYPDYSAALNERMREGVTPENNAAVLLQQAFGPAEIPKELRENYFKQLGMPELPEKGAYFVPEYEMIRRMRVNQPSANEGDDTIYEHFGAAQMRPWSAAEFPIVAAWLKTNEKPIGLALEASQRPRMFSPIVLPPGASLLSNTYPQLQAFRQLTTLLITHAMFELEQGEPMTAWKDLMACHRLARLIMSTEVGLVSTLVAYANEGQTAAAEVTFLHDAKLSTEQIKAMRTELDALPPIRDPADVFDLGERFFFLDMVRDTATKRINSVDDLRKFATGAASAKSNKSAEKHPELNHLIDWNEPLRAGNVWYDRMADAARIPDRRARQAAITQIESGRNKIGDQKEAVDLTVDFFSKPNSKALLTSKVTDIFLTLLLPPPSAIINAYDRSIFQSKMNDVAFALAEYRADHARYPDTVAELVPKYLKEIPEDIFKRSAGPIGYRRAGDAYVLWSVSRDGIDSNGRTEEEDEDSDDIIVRPAPLKKSDKDK